MLLITKNHCKSDIRKILKIGTEEPQQYSVNPDQTAPNGAV